MTLFPFRFCRRSTAARLDALEHEVEFTKARLGILAELHVQTRHLANRSAKELAAVIRDAAGKGGAS